MRIYIRSAALGIVVAYMFLMLPGCASVPLLPEYTKMKALQSLPPANKSYIYIVRPFQLQSAPATNDIRIDNTIVGEIVTGTFIVVEVDPGKHDIILGLVASERKSVYEYANAVKLTCLPGKIYYYRVDQPWLLSPVSEEEGQKLLKGADMVKDSKITLQ